MNRFIQQISGYDIRADIMDSLQTFSNSNNSADMFCRCRSIMSNFIVDKARPYIIAVSILAHLLNVYTCTKEVGLLVEYVETWPNAPGRQAISLCSIECCRQFKKTYISLCAHAAISFHFPACKVHYRFHSRDKMASNSWGGKIG